jgi:hypothetical protein
MSAYPAAGAGSAAAELNKLGTKPPFEDGQVGRQLGRAEEAVGQLLEMLQLMLDSDVDKLEMKSAPYVRDRPPTNPAAANPANPADPRDDQKKREAERGELVPCAARVHMLVERVASGLEKTAEVRARLASLTERLER